MEGAGAFHEALVFRTQSADRDFKRLAVDEQSNFPGFDDGGVLRWSLRCEFRGTFWSFHSEVFEGDEFSEDGLAVQRGPLALL